MRQLSTRQLTGLIGVHESPCISLYQPTHRRHPENQQDPIRYRNLLGQLEDSLSRDYPTRQVRALLDKFQPLARDDRFWNYRTEGLALFGSPERFEMYELQRPVPELTIVADSFHVKPLIRILQSADRYQVLCLTRREAKLYEGNRDVLDAVELTEFPAIVDAAVGDEATEPQHLVGSYGVKGGAAIHYGHASSGDKSDKDVQRFFRVVAQGILEHHSRPSGLPLLLAALPENQVSFRNVSDNPHLLDDGITTNPDVLGLDDLRHKAWEHLEPLYLARLERLKESFQSARSQHLGSADLSDVAQAAVAGRVATILIEAERVISGTGDRTTGSIQAAEAADDMLDDLAELVLAAGGEVVVVPGERMPTDSGLAAIYRF
jgi:hypothetical protein